MVSIGMALGVRVDSRRCPCKGGAPKIVGGARVESGGNSVKLKRNFGPGHGEKTRFFSGSGKKRGPPKRGLGKKDPKTINYLL